MARSQAQFAATEHPTTLDIAWAAGIYEGEGSIEYRPGPSPLVEIVQKDRWLLDRLCRLFGGSVRSYKQGKYFRWTNCGARGRGFALTIYSFLSPRRQKQMRVANLFAQV